MQMRSLAPLAGILLLGLTPGAAQAQAGAQVRFTVRAVVPSIVQYVVDPTTLGADGEPSMRVITNDPAIRMAFARGVTPEILPAPLAAGSPETSGHAKGGGPQERPVEGPQVLMYTVTSP